MDARFTATEMRVPANRETGYGDHMTPRARVLLMALTVAVLAPGAVAGMGTAHDAVPASPSLAVAHEAAVGLVAVPVRSQLRPAPNGVPELTVIIAVGAAAWFSVRRRSLRGLAFRLGDVGDRWRALLFGAPPAFL